MVRISLSTYQVQKKKQKNMDPFKNWNDTNFLLKLLEKSRVENHIPI